jgi:ADP-ribose pyrophosphatase
MMVLMDIWQRSLQPGDSFDTNPEAEYRRTPTGKQTGRGGARKGVKHTFHGIMRPRTPKKDENMKESVARPGPKGARVLSSAIVYEGPIFGIRRDEVIEPGGVRATREVITHPGSVVVLPVLPDGRILLIRQYRHATRQYLWELVAGRMDSGETPAIAASRELIEETGFRARHFRVFLDVFPTPGFLEERMFILLAEGLTAGEAEPEEDEKILARAYSRKQLEAMIRTGKLRDAKSIAGILFYFRFLTSGRRRRR